MDSWDPTNTASQQLTQPILPPNGSQQVLTYGQLGPNQYWLPTALTVLTYGQVGPNQYCLPTALSVNLWTAGTQPILAPNGSHSVNLWTAGTQPILPPNSSHSVNLWTAGTQSILLKHWCVSLQEHTYTAVNHNAPRSWVASDQVAKFTEYVTTDLHHVLMASRRLQSLNTSTSPCRLHQTTTTTTILQALYMSTCVSRHHQLQRDGLAYW